MSPPDPPSSPHIAELLSGADVERVFGRSARTLRRWEAAGHLTPVRVWAPPSSTAPKRAGGAP